MFLSGVSNTFFVIIAIVLLIIKILLNLSKFISCQILLHRYFKWIEDKKWDLVEKKARVIKLFKDANLDDRYMQRLRPAGYGKLISYTQTLYDSFPSNERDTYQATVQTFHEAIGIYKDRMFETINPLFWIESLIFLPKKIFLHFGANSKSVIIKIVQFLYWIIGVLATLALTVFSNEVATFVKNILGIHTP